MECFQKLSSFEDVNKLKVKELKAILERYGQSVSGKKNDLVLRCCAILDKTNNEGKVLKDQENVNNVKANGGDVTVEKILERTGDGEWTKDLRTLPEFHFVELYDYLVRRTMKYDHESIRTLGYKKLKAFQFFKEGHLKDLQVCSVGSLSYLKAEILASMKQIKYLAVVVFNHHGNVVKAACKCPAGRGVDGCGHCNHVGCPVCSRGLKEHNEVVSCTSRICQWNVPRNIKVQPKPVDDILFTRYRFGKESSSIPKSSLYDPRAPSDRTVNNEALETLCESMSSSVGSSSFFLFHKVKSTYNQSSNVEIESYCEALPEVTAVLPQELEEPDLPFNDDYDIKSSSFKSMVDSYRETITETEIQQIERMTRGQSSNKAWQELKQNKLTASNFHTASTRKAEPDKLLKSIMYSFNTDENPIASLKYGQLHEKDAVHCYIKAEIASGNTGIKVWEVGTIISKERPGFGASLDRKVFDPTARGSKIGGLEVKCPISKQGQTPEEACGDPSFYMIMKDGMPKLKEGHRYYYQVQGQMYVCELEWVDFVVWLGGDSIIKERLSFNRKWWINEALPQLDYFYKHAFLPEVFTRRVKRGIRLYRHNGWQSYKQHMKYGRSS